MTGCIWFHVRSMDVDLSEQLRPRRHAEGGEAAQQTAAAQPPALRVSSVSATATARQRGGSAQPGACVLSPVLAFPSEAAEQLTKSRACIVAHLLSGRHQPSACCRVFFCSLAGVDTFCSGSLMGSGTMHAEAVQPRRSPGSQRRVVPEDAAKGKRGEEMEAVWQVQLSGAAQLDAPCRRK